VLSEEVHSKALQFTYKGLAITARVIHDLIMRYSYRPATPQQAYGKQSLKKLNRKNRALENIPVSGQDLLGLQRELRQYGVDYAVTARKTEPGVFDIYFKGGDVNQIQSALRTYAWNHFHRQQRPTIQDRIRSADDRAQRQQRTSPGMQTHRNMHQTP
jgi:hypothetical protein